MGTNYIEKYELIDGMAIINNNLEVVTANENFYKFVGISRYYTMMDIIHQVDLDDFIEVGNSLRVGQKKTMVIRMRRVDNSYRWILTDVLRNEIKSSIEGEDDYEYLELHMNDVQGLQHENKQLSQMLYEYSSLLAMEGELIFSLDVNSNEVQLYRFVDNKMVLVEKKSKKEIEDDYRINKLIVEEDLPLFDEFIKDINANKSSFSHKFRVCTTDLQMIEKGKIEIKGKTFYDDYNKPDRILGTIRRLDDNEGYSKKLIIDNISERKLSKEDVLTYVKQNIQYNSTGEIILMLLQIDGIDEVEKEQGKQAADEIYSFVYDMCCDAVGFRGVVGADDDRTIHIAIAANGITIEVNTRAVIESLRNMIKWRYKEKNNGSDITFSIGISRYPFNGKEYEKVVRKAYRALDISIQKGRKRYILYKETIHGEM